MGYLFDKSLEVILRWVKEEAAALAGGEVRHELIDLGTRTSTASFLAAAAIPFAKMDATPSHILFVDIPVQHPRTSALHVAIPLSAQKLGALELPTQLSIEARGRAPASVLWGKEGFAAPAAALSLVARLRDDAGLQELAKPAFVWTHYTSPNEEGLHIKPKWGYAIDPLDGDRFLAVINTGSEGKGYLKPKRIYELKLRLAFLARVAELVQAENFQGEPERVAGVPVHERVRRNLARSPPVAPAAAEDAPKIELPPVGTSERRTVAELWAGSALARGMAADDVRARLLAKGHPAEETDHIMATATGLTNDTRIAEALARKYQHLSAREASR